MGRVLFRGVIALLALLAPPALSGSSAVSAEAADLVTICLHTAGGDVEVMVSEQAAVKLWEKGLATLGPCASDDDGGGGL